MRNIKGFTMVELLVAMAISGVVAIAIYQAATMQERSGANQKQITEMQQNIRAAMYIIAGDIRLAGFDNSPGRTSNAGFVQALPGLIQVTMDLSGGDNDGIDNDGDNVPDEGDEANWSDGVLDDANDMNITYGFNTTDDSNSDGITNSGAAATLRRESCNPNTGTCGGMQPLAENIQAIGFEYGLDTNDDGNINLWTNNATGAVNQIRAVRISILGRTRNQLRDELLDTRQYRVGRNNDGSDRMVGPFNDRYRRRLVELIVKTRNII